MRKLSLFLGLALIAALCACSTRKHAGESETVCLDIVKAVSAEDKTDSWKLEDHFDYLGTLNTGENQDAYMAFPKFLDYDEESVILFGSDKVIRLKLKDGSTVAKYGRNGRGPGEYAMVFNCFVKNGDVYVVDINSQVLVYAPDGEFKKSFSIGESSFGMNNFDVLDDAHFVIGYSSLSGKDQLLDVLDADFNVTRSSSLHPDEKAVARRGATRIVHFDRFNGNLCTTFLGNDTLYRITPEADLAYLVTDLGNKEGSGPDDIKVMSTFVCGNNVFISAENKSALHRMIFDFKSGDLLYKSSTGGQDDADVVWPNYSGGNLMIAPADDGESYLCYRLK